MDKNDDDGAVNGGDVGYGKPPVSTRFTKGQSGNLAGRPPNSVSNRKIVECVLSEKQRLNDQPAGARVLYTSLEIVVMLLKQQAASGNQPATKLFTELSEDYGRQEPVDDEAGYIVLPERLTEEEWEAKYSPKDELPVDDLYD